MLSKSQYHGKGSFGNGIAMQIAPLALFSWNLDEFTLFQVGLLTHFNPSALYGAFCQALAIKAAFTLPLYPLIGQSMINGKKLAIDTLSNIISTFRHMQSSKLLLTYFCPKITEIVESVTLFDETSLIALEAYINKFDKIKTILDQDWGISNDQLVKQFGNSVSAIESVPTALFLFLDALKLAFTQSKYRNFQGITDSTLFLDTMSRAISLGGDTDTLASMTGAMLGAWMGYSQKDIEITVPYLHSFFPSSETGMSEKFEGFSTMLEMAEQLHDICYVSTVPTIPQVLYSGNEAPTND